MKHVHNGWTIDVQPFGPGWKAFIYRSGATMHEGTIPHTMNPADKDGVLAEAILYIDMQSPA